MKFYILSNDALDSLKVNVEHNEEYYKNDSSKWIKEQLGYNPFIEFNKRVEEFSLKPEGKETENTKILYSAMKNLSDSEATEERLWAGLTHSICWDFMRDNLKYNMENNKRIKFDSKTILNRYYFNTKVNGWKRSMYINTLSKMWWLGRLCYDKENKQDPFCYLDLFETAFSHKIINMLSSNILGNDSIRFSYFEAGLYIRSLGIEIKGDTMVPLMMYLNELGGRIVLDILSRDEIYDLLVGYTNKNIDEIKSR